MSDMSGAELEQAVMAPYRWIKLCAAFQKQHLDDSEALLHPRTTRLTGNSIAVGGYLNTDLFIVPGGRYLVSYSSTGIFVWDLGYTSNNNCKLIASLGMEHGSFSCMVQATPDGMGLTVLSSHA